MNRRALTISITAALVLGAASAAAAQAGGPERIRESYTDRFHDDFILDLCGIDTFTTVTERWTLKTIPDGSQTFHVVRTFVPDDPRIPIEKGAGTGRFAPDGTKTLVVGKPIQLFYRDGRHMFVDAGRVEFGEQITAHGHHPFFDADLASLYCP